MNRADFSVGVKASTGALKKYSRCVQFRFFSRRFRHTPFRHCGVVWPFLSLGLVLKASLGFVCCRQTVFQAAMLPLFSASNLLSLLCCFAHRYSSAYSALLFCTSQCSLESLSSVPSQGFLPLDWSLVVLFAPLEGLRSGFCFVMWSL